MTSDHPWLEALNERQIEAVTFRAAPLLVLAGPGSGKTRILTRRIAWLIREKGARPEQILAVTFTNRAAEQMRERLFDLLEDQASRVWIYTFHATAVRILRRFGARIDLDPGFSIIDEDEQRHALNRILGQEGLSRELYPPGQIISYLSRAKSALADPSIPPPETDPILADIAGVYETWLQKRQALDFDDLIRYAVHLLRSDEDTREHFARTLRHILVDEYQDINAAQYEMLKLLAPPTSSITIVADDDQTIYGWRGSKPELIDQYIERYHPYIVKLDISYRCPPKILFGAQRLIAHQRTQERQRTLRSQKENDTPIFHYIFQTLQQEQRWLVTLIQKLTTERGYKPGDIAILYRTHSLGEPAEQALAQAGVPVQRLRKESFFDEPITREIVRFLQMVRALSEETFTAAVNFPLRLVDELTMIQLRRLAEDREMDLIDLARRAQDFPEISPLTRAHLERFLQLVQTMPLPTANAEQAVQAVLLLFDRLRSPWRQEDVTLLEGFMAFLNPVDQADALAEAIDAGRSLGIVHPDTVDGYAAAAIVRQALAGYLGVEAPSWPASAYHEGLLAEEGCLIVLGGSATFDGAAPGRVDLEVVQGPYALAACAWRCMQSLLLAYENLAEGRFVVYDVETTGTNVRRDEIVEIAAAAYQDQQPAGEIFHRFVRPSRGYIPAAATQVHGIRFEDVADAEDAAAILPVFLDYVDGSIVVGHNIARFDNRFVDRTCGELYGGKGFNPDYIDTLRLARRLLPEARRYTLEGLLASLGLDQEIKHRAADDVARTAELFFALTDRVLAEKEREALAEALPLVAFGTLAAGVELVEENRTLLDGAARVLAAGRGDLEEVLAVLPAHLQGPAQELALQLAGRTAPTTGEDLEWKTRCEDFMEHVQAYLRYQPDSSLAGFLDYQALLTSQDTFARGQDESRVTLMTLHNAKGTEFPVVIIIGVEHEHLPLWRTLNDPEQLAEERRVFYVGITRAMEAVYLFSVRDRADNFIRNPSRFAFEMPAETVRRFSIDANNRMREMK